MTRLNPDESWHLVAHNENTFQQSLGKDEKQKVPERKEEAFGAFDVFADGRIEHAPESSENRGLTAIFFKLPDDAAASEKLSEAATEPNAAVFSFSPRAFPFMTFVLTLRVFQLAGWCKWYMVLHSQKTRKDHENQ